MENKQGSTMGSEGVNKLTEVLQNRMRGMSEQPQVLDFGVIQPDMSLLTNKFPVPIPQSDYMVCRQLTLGPSAGPAHPVGQVSRRGFFGRPPPASCPDSREDAAH